MREYAPIFFPSNVFTIGLTIESIKELEGALVYVLFNFLKFRAQIEMYNLMDIDFIFKENACDI
jgi:hypothetical protein